MEAKAVLIKATKLVDSWEWILIKDPIIPINAEYIINTGIINVQAKTRVTTRYLNGLIAETSMASICSVTFMEPNSAPILEPTFPAHIKAVTSGAKARITAMEIRDGSQEVAPKEERLGRLCLVKTIPTTKPVRLIRGKDWKPM